MIDRRDIMDRSGELSLQAHVVAKDYVLGWLLAGIAQHDEIGGSWVFKGGTCLEKIHFETYRFSEDLDFTLAEEQHLDEEVLRRVSGEISEWIYSESGIEIPREQKRVASSRVSERLWPQSASSRAFRFRVRRPWRVTAPSSRPTGLIC